MELEYSTANEELITDAVYELITAQKCPKFALTVLNSY